MWEARTPARWLADSSELAELENTGAASPQTVNTALDIALFAERFAHPRGITRRFIGTAPFAPVTTTYNQQIKAHSLDMA